MKEDNARQGFFERADFEAVAQSVAMSISGHKTVSMFYRYNITSDDDRRVALEQVSQHLAGQTSSRSAVPMKARNSA
jgi:hypothetical protein